MVRRGGLRKLLRWAVRALVAIVAVVAVFGTAGAVSERNVGLTAFFVFVLGVCGLAGVRIAHRAHLRAVGVSASVDPLSSTGLDAYRRHAWWTLAVAFVLLAGFVTAASIVENRSKDLQRTGLRVLGTVIATHGAGENGSVRVAFTSAGQARVTAVHLDASNPRYHGGEHVTVIIDRNDPHHVTLPGETNQSLWTTQLMIYALVVGVFGAVMGSTMLARHHRQLLVLLANPWQPVRVRTQLLRRGLLGSYRRIEIEVSPGAWQRIRFAAVTRWRLSASQLYRAQDAEVAGDVGGYAVIRKPDSTVLLTIKAKGEPTKDTTSPMVPSSPTEPHRGEPSVAAP
jgi:hypothetical protein